MAFVDEWPDSDTDVLRSTGEGVARQAEGTMRTRTAAVHGLSRCMSARRGIEAWKRERRPVEAP